MVEAIQYLPTVAWSTVIQDVVMLSAGIETIPGTYRVTVVPENINDPGAVDAEKEVGFYIKDFVGHVYKITQINVGGDPTRVVVSDDFLTGYGPQTGRTAVVYKSVAMGESPYIAPLEHKRLDQSALDYSRKVELDILYKRLYNEVFENDLGKWLLNYFSNNIEFGQALGQDHEVNGNRSIAIGQGNVTDSFMEIVLGAYNSLASGQTPTSWVETDRLITLGNGQSNSSRSVALEVFKSGFMKIYNALKFGEFQNGAELPEDGTVQWLVDKLQVYFIDTWYNFLTGVPQTITGETTNSATAAGHTHELGEHKHDKLYQPNETNAFVYTDNSGTLHIDGNIVQNGSAYETHAEQVYTKDDTIILRDGAVAALGPGQYVGFTAKLYDGVNDGQLVFDNSGTARVGDVGNLQPLTTRVETPITNLYYAYWESANTRLNFRELTAAYVANVPAGNISSITVQAALNELDSDKAPASGSSSYIWNGTSQQPGNFNISGSGTAYNFIANGSDGVQISARSSVGSGYSTFGGTSVSESRNFAFGHIAEYGTFTIRRSSSNSTDPLSTGDRIFDLSSTLADFHSVPIQATTAKLTNLTDGYIPYHISDASGLGNSPISIGNNNGVFTTIKGGDTGPGSIIANFTDNLNNSKVFVRGDGNVGIGYYGDGYSNGSEINNKLAVNGSGYFNGTVNSTGYLLNGNNLFSSLSSNTLMKWDGTKAISVTDNSTNWNTAYSWGNHALAGYATQSWVSSNFDNYWYWNIQVNSGAVYSVGSTSSVNLIAGSNISLSRTNGDITITSTGGTNYYPNSMSFGTGTGTLSLTGPGVNLSTSLDGRYSLLGHNHSGTYDYYGNWNLSVNSGATTTVTSGATVNFTAGTNVTLSKTGNSITINSTASGGTTDHAALSNLTYAASGHTGFAAINGNSSQSFYALNLSAAGFIDATGDITGNELYRRSSKELKYDINSYDNNALDILLNTKIYSYKLKVNDKPAVGFIAEDTDKVLSGENQKQHVFGNHLGILTKAIQEQQAQIEELHKEIDKLKNKSIFKTIKKWISHL